MTILSKVGSLFIKKAAPTAGQNALKTAVIVGKAVKPYAIEAAKVAGTMTAVWAGLRLGAGIVDVGNACIKKGGRLAQQAIRTATPMSRTIGAAARNTTAAAVGIGSGMLLKATGIFRQAKEVAAAPKKATPKKVARANKTPTPKKTLVEEGV